MAYNVLVAAPAEKALDESISYIAREKASPAAAASLLDAYEAALQALASMPHVRGVVAEYQDATGVDVRRWPVKNYEIDYYISDENSTVYIVAFLHGLQNRVEHLRELLPR